MLVVFAAKPIHNVVGGGLVQDSAAPEPLLEILLNHWMVRIFLKSIVKCFASVIEGQGQQWVILLTRSTRPPKPRQSLTSKLTDGPEGLLKQNPKLTYLYANT